MALVVSNFRRTAFGYLFADFWNRPDSDNLGNGWTEIEPGGSGHIALSNGFLRYNADLVGGYAWREPDFELSPLPSSLTIQGAVRNVSSNDNCGLIIRSDIGDVGFGSETHYHMDLYQIGDVLRLFKVVNGTTTETWTASAVHSTTSWNGIRLVVEPEGSDVRLRALWTGALGGGTPNENISTDFTQLISELDDVSPITLLNEQFGVVGYSAGQLDGLILAGHGITVAGVPSGWKVKVDARTAVVSDGTDVVIDTATWAMPMGSIRILDSLDVEQAILTPATPAELPTAAGGIFPGDSFEVTTVTDIVYSACEAGGAISWVKE